MFGSRHIRLPIGIPSEGGRIRDIEIDSMTGLDEEAIASTSVGNNGVRAMTRLFQRTVQTIGTIHSKRNREDLFPAELFSKMYVPDRDYLFLAIRSLDFESNLEYTQQCPECGERVGQSTTPSSLQVYEWPDDEEVTIEIILNQGFFDRKTGNRYKNVVWEYPTGEDQTRISKLKRSEQGSAMLYYGIRSVTDENGEKYEHLSMETVRRLSSADRRLMMDQIEENAPGLDLQQALECPSCGHEWTHELDLLGFFKSGKIKAETRPGKSKRVLREKN